MGVLPEAEAQEVAQLISQNNELRKEVEKIESSLMAYSGNFVEKEPQNSILENALAEIEKEEKAEGLVVEDMDNQQEGKVKQLNVWLYVAIAASVLLLISIGLNFRFYQNWQKTGSELLALKSESSQIAEENASYKASLDVAESFFRSSSGCT